MTHEEINVETWKFVHWLSFRRRTQFWTHIVKMWNSCPLAWRHKSPLGPKIGANIQTLMTREEINVETWKFVHWLSFRRRTQFWTHIVKMWNSCPLAWRHKSPLGPKIGANIQTLMTREEINVEEIKTFLETWNKSPLGPKIAKTYYTPRNKCWNMTKF